MATAVNELLAVFSMPPVLITAESRMHASFQWWVWSGKLLHEQGKFPSISARMGGRGVEQGRPPGKSTACPPGSLVLSQITNSLVEFFCPDTGLYEGILNLEISFQLLAGILSRGASSCDVEPWGVLRVHAFHTSADARAQWALGTRNAARDLRWSPQILQVCDKHYLAPICFCRVLKGKSYTFPKLTCWIFPHTPKDPLSKNKFRNMYIWHSSI